MRACMDLKGDPGERFGGCHATIVNRGKATDKTTGAKTGGANAVLSRAGCASGRLGAVSCTIASQTRLSGLPQSDC